MSVPYGARHTFLHESLVKKSNFAASVSPLRGSTYVSTPYALDSKYLGVSVSPLRGSTYVSTGQIAAYKHVLDGVSPLRGSTYVSTLKQYPLQQNNKVSVPYGARHTFLQATVFFVVEAPQCQSPTGLDIRFYESLKNVGGAWRMCQSPTGLDIRFYGS